MKKLIYFFEFSFVYVLFIFCKILGYKNSSNLGFVIGKTFGPIFRSKKLIINNLNKANISLNEQNEKIASNVLGNYGRIFLEYPYIEKFRNGNLDNFIKIYGIEHLENI